MKPASNFDGAKYMPFLRHELKNLINKLVSDLTTSA